MKRITIFLFLIVVVRFGLSQNNTVYTLDQCYSSAFLNYPNFKQTELNNAIFELNIKNTKTNYYPNLNLNGQASWQSDVTKMPIPPTPGFTNPVIPNDWYKINLDVNQMIYDGGATSGKKELYDKELNISNQQVQIELYQLKERVTHLYFNTLFLQKNIEILDVLEHNLAVTIKDALLAYENGVVLKSEVDKLKVERVKVAQQKIEKESDMIALTSALSEITGLNIDSYAELQTPEVLIQKFSFVNNRPEYLLLTKQQEKLSVAKKITSVKRKPLLSAFGQAGYGRPGYDMLNNKFDDYYMIGARLSWNIWDWNKVKNEKQILDIQSEIINKKKESFEQNLRADLSKRIQDISKFEKLLSSDNEIVILQENVVETTLSQFNNGTITSTTYLIELNKLAKAKLNQESHSLQLIFAKYQYLTAIGNL